MLADHHDVGPGQRRHHGRYLVIAPIETNEVTRVTPGLFDDYVRANASRAVWLFLPEGDILRVGARPPVAREGAYVLVRAAAPTAPR